MKPLHYLLIFSPFLFYQCDTRQRQDEPLQAGMPGDSATGQAQEGEVWVFERRAEPRENAFTILVPKGWLIEGGIFRVDPNSQGGPAQSIEAKLDMGMKDPSGKATMRFLPETYFMDTRWMPAASMFPPGSNYNGMTVMYLPEVSQFIQQVAFPYAHPGLGNPQAGKYYNLPDVVNRLRQEDAPVMAGAQFGYRAGFQTFYYEEGGQPLEEVIVAAIMDFGQMGGGLWKNRSTFLMRAPREQFESYKPVFGTMLSSIQINPSWARAEIQGQMQRAGIMIQTQQELNRIEREIAEARQNTNAQIQHDQYLNLMGQEDYVNPFSGKTEQGSNEWNYRWQNERGDIIYTNNTNYDPNADPGLQVQGYKRSKVKER